MTKFLVIQNAQRAAGIGLLRASQPSCFYGSISHGGWLVPISLMPRMKCARSPRSKKRFHQLKHSFLSAHAISNQQPWLSAMASRLMFLKPTFQVTSSPAVNKASWVRLFQTPAIFLSSFLIQNCKAARQQINSKPSLLMLTSFQHSLAKVMTVSHQQQKRLTSHVGA